MTVNAEVPALARGLQILFFTRVGRISLYLMFGLFACFEAANFTGFSWTHLRRLSDEELINVAIRYNYPNIYSNSAELKGDYSSFNPEVYYWPDLIGKAEPLFWTKFFGLKLFYVKLPDAVVVVASDGIARFSRECSVYWCSPPIAPDHPKLGIVGTVQDGPPSYDAARDFAVQWINGSEGSVFVSGHCFAAFSESQQPVLRISRTNKDNAITIREQYGYRLVAVKAWSSYSTMKISEEAFLRSRTCDRMVRAAWPNVGGASWKR